MAAIARQLITLSKPRVISLLVLTGACGVWKASGGVPDVTVLIVVMAAGALAAAGSNAINQGIDADIDAVMSRTRTRPVPSHHMRPGMAIAAGLTFVTAAVVAMAVGTNLVAAALTLAAAGVYVLVYSVILKRRSWNNIVIGGAAGAFPPMIGAAAVVGSVDAVGLYMFAVVFFWTPPHFWALSILLRDDYSAANVPMLAAVASTRATAVQIALYIVLLVAMAWLPLVAGYGGWTYGAVATVLGAQWLRRTQPLFRQEEPSYREALSAYKYSLLYLALIFLVLAAEPSLPWY